mgnify:CR=1 FL=1
MELTGKKALVTGGSRGIGRAIVLELARLGADVAFDYKGDPGEAEAVAQAVRKLGKKALAFSVEAADYSMVGEVVKNVLKEFGALDILVNNAGITRDAVIWKMTPEQWDTVIGVNLKGYFNHIRAVAPVFKEQRRGKIVNIASINGLRGKFGQSNYCASKAGVIGLTKSVAKELGRYQVNVNCVAPGMIETEMTKTLPAEAMEGAIKESALGKLGRPEDVAHLTAFLVSEKAAHITGAVIQVDGGQYI